MIAVSDTSPLNYLVLIEAIEVLPNRFEKVLVPDAVAAELEHPAAPQRVREWIASPPSWLEKCRLKQPPISARLGRGEIEAISLAAELGANQLLLDDRQARSAAISLNLNVAGTLSLLFDAARHGRLDFDAALARLRATTFRFHPTILAELQNLD